MAGERPNSNLFAACRKAGKEKIKGLIYVGTVCSFPLTRQNTLNPEPLHEDELFPALPESAYGWSKLMGQLEIGYLEKETGMPIVKRGRKLGFECDRCAAPDIMGPIFEESVKRNKTHYF